jgi:hypothetical protein
VQIADYDALCDEDEAYAHTLAPACVPARYDGQIQSCVRLEALCPRNAGAVLGEMAAALSAP